MGLHEGLPLILSHRLATVEATALLALKLQSANILNTVTHDYVLALMVKHTGRAAAVMNRPSVGS